MPDTRTVIAFLLASIVGTLLVSLANTHIILGGLSAVGAEFSTEVRMEAILSDLAGLGPTLALLTMIGFLIAFPVAGYISRLLGPSWRRVGFTLAGGATIIVMMMAVKLFYSTIMDSVITPIASAREMSGLLTLAIGGAGGGFLFALLKPAAPR
jgi:hypothetical protein